MALRLIKTLGDNRVSVKVYYDSDWREYITKAVIGGKVETSKRWSHTDDKQDALDTAETILKWNIDNGAKKSTVKHSAKDILADLEKKSKAKPRKSNPYKNTRHEIKEKDLIASNKKNDKNKMPRSAIATALLDGNVYVGLKDNSILFAMKDEKKAISKIKSLSKNNYKNQFELRKIDLI